MHAAANSSEMRSWATLWSWDCRQAALGTFPAQDAERWAAATNQTDARSEACGRPGSYYPCRRPLLTVLRMRSRKYPQCPVVRTKEARMRADTARAQISSYDKNPQSREAGLLYVNLVVRQDVEQVAFPAFNLIVDIQRNPVLLPVRLDPDQHHFVSLRILRKAAGQRNRIEYRRAILDLVHSRCLHFTQHRYLGAIDLFHDDVHGRQRNILCELYTDFLLELDCSLSNNGQFTDERQRDFPVGSDDDGWRELRLLVHENLDDIVRAKLELGFAIGTSNRVRCRALC